MLIDLLRGKRNFVMCMAFCISIAEVVILGKVADCLNQSLQCEEHLICQAE